MQKNASTMGGAREFKQGGNKMRDMKLGQNSCKYSPAHKCQRFIRALMSQPEKRFTEAAW